MKRRFHVDESRVTLPKGTRVVLKTDLKADDGYLCKAGTIAVVVELSYDSYTVRTPAGRHFACQRDQVVIQKRDLLEEIGRRGYDWESLSRRVIYSAVVGSVAWGLTDEHSDEDIKGVFLLPFEETVGLWQPPDEIQDPASDTQLWEVQKTVYQGLRADASTLEMLWSPHTRTNTDLGSELVAQRRMFVSKNIFGTFGRYAMSQFRKMRASAQRQQVQQAIVAQITQQATLQEQELVERLCEGDDPVISGRHAKRRARDEIKDLYRSLFDRGVLSERGFEPLVRLLRSDNADNSEQRIEVIPPRWKNAYNLLRLLRSGIRWLNEGEPLIEVTGAVRQELLDVKRGQRSLEDVLALADSLSSELEDAHQRTSLPDQPDYEAAHRFLLQCRESAAHEHLRDPQPVVTAVAETANNEGGAKIRSVQEPPRQFEIPEASLRQFLSRYPQLDFVVCSLVGSHSYGFPSRDSDFDLKAIHLAPADELLGLDDPAPTIQFLGDVSFAEGELEIDFTSHEARGALRRLLRGDGNVLERIFSPYLIAPPTADARLEELRQLTHDNLSRRFFRHYGGFFRGMVRMYEKEQTKRVKPLLYMFRVALTGVHLLREAEVLADLDALLKIYPFKPAEALLAIKRGGAELETIDDDRPYLELLPQLEALLQRAHDESTLPDDPAAVRQLDHWLKRCRSR